MKIAVCMIVSNASRYIRKCLETVIPHIDELVIVDTDLEEDECSSRKEIYNTVKSLRGDDLDFTYCYFNKRTHPECFLKDEQRDTWPGGFTQKFFLANFGAARQFGWEKATSHYLMWVDADDTLENGQNLRSIVQKMEETGITTGILNYDYAHDSKGNVTLKQSRERIFKRGIAKWHGIIHEVLMPVTKGMFFDSVNVVHHRDELKIVSPIFHRNLKILLNYFEDRLTTEVDPRMLFYKAMEEQFLYPDLAVTDFRLYCERSGWALERAVARSLIGKILEGKNALKEALQEYAIGLMDYPLPELYFGAARIAYFQSQWDECVRRTIEGFRYLDSEQHFPHIRIPLDCTHKPHTYFNFALNKLGRVKEALESCIKGLEHWPDDSNLLQNKILYEKYLGNTMTKEDTITSIKFESGKDFDKPSTLPTKALVAFAIELAKKVRDERSIDDMIALVSTLPESIIEHDRFRDFLDFYEKSINKTDENVDRIPINLIYKPNDSVLPSKNIRILFWIGPAFEKWSPESIHSGGIGGSETAAALMASCFHKLGYVVTVLSDIDKECYFDGVRYVPYQQCSQKPEQFETDILIVSRYVAAFEIPIKSKLNILWVHDIHAGQPSAQVDRGILKADRIFALSKWHKDFLLKTYPQVHPSKIIVTRNGIESNLFTRQTSTERSNKVIYSSSPDRGLATLLDLWPEILKKVPDAELHIYYGFHNWEESAKRAGNNEVLGYINYLKHRLSSTERTFYHGRVGQVELAKAFRASKVWAYPTWFSETFCITALEAQAAGCVPVTSAIAALKETVKQGILIDPPNTSDEYTERFIREVSKLLTDEQYRLSMCSGDFEAKHEHDWMEVAKEWDFIFETVQVEKLENPLPQYGEG